MHIEYAFTLLSNEPKECFSFLIYLFTFFFLYFFS